NGVTTLVNCPRLGITKSYVPSPPNGPLTPLTIGQTVEFDIVVTNSGTAPAAGVTVKDTIPAGFSFAGASASQGSCPPPVGGVVTCNLGTLSNVAPGNTATVKLFLTIASCTPGPNTATVTSTTEQPGIPAGTATASAPATLPLI